MHAICGRICSSRDREKDKRSRILHELRGGNVGISNDSRKDSSGPSRVASSSSILSSSSLLTSSRDLVPVNFRCFLAQSGGDVSHHSLSTLPLSLSLPAKFEGSLRMGSRARAVYNG